MIDIHLTMVAVIILILVQGLESFMKLIFWAKGTTIKQSWLSVISPLITAYILYGLITTASEAAVKTYVYIEGGMFVLLCVFAVLAVVVMLSEDE